MSEQAAEREALEEGVVSAFWKAFTEHVVYEWGPAGVRYQQAVHKAANDPNAVIELQKILHTQEQIGLLLRWPTERLNALKQDLRHPAEQSMSRRGPSL